MAQDTSRPGSRGNFRGPNPNRDRKREPAVIEGEVVSAAPVEPAGATPTGATAASAAAAASAGPAQPQEPGKAILDPGPDSGRSTATDASASTDASAEAIASSTSSAATEAKAPAAESPEPVETLQTSEGDVPKAPRSPEPTGASNGAAAARDRVRRANGDHAAPPPPPKTLLPTAAALAALLLAGTSLYVALTATRGAVGEAEVTSLAQRLDKADARLGSLEQKIAAVEARPAAAPVDLAPLAARIETVEKLAQGAQAEAARAAARPAPAAPAPAPRVDLQPLEKRLSALEARPVPTFDPAPLEQRLAGLQAQVEPLKKALEAPKTEVRATQEPSVVGTPPGDAAAVAVVAESLRQKLDRGAPFRPEIAALEKLGTDAQRLAPLKGLAEKGAPGAQTLAQSFRQVASATAQAGQGEAPDNFLDRLTRNAASLVRVRPVGEATGEDPGALVSRIETALERGDVRSAVATWDQLPGSAKGPSREWADRARLRAEADASVRQILDEAIERLGRTQ